DAASVDLDPSTSGTQTTYSSNGSWSVDNTGLVTYTPAADFHGTTSITYTVKDNSGTPSNAGTITITVNSVNDQPSFVKGADETVNEDDGAKTISSWAMSMGTGAINESSEVLTFTVTNDNNSLFAVQPSVNPTTGDLTYTLATDAFGSAIVTVVLSDDGGITNGGVDTYTTQTFMITVNPVNDRPSFVNKGDEAIDEDAGLQIVNGWVTSMNPGAANESSQILTFTVTNNNNSLFSVQPSIDPSTGNLTYQTVANASGTVTVTVVLTDDGGTANGGNDTFSAQTFTIAINSVNDPPSFVKGDDQHVHEGDGAKTIANWATNITAGEGESTQVLTFVVTNDNSSLFTVPPSIDKYGKLSYELAAGVTGLATITVVLADDGGTANGGADTSIPQTFVIEVQPKPVNLPPVVSYMPFTLGEDGSLTDNIFSSSDLDPEGTALVISPTHTGPSHGTIDIHSDGSFVYMPSPDFNGMDEVIVQICDSGTPSACSFKTIHLTVTPVNDSPVVIGTVTNTTKEGLPVEGKLGEGDVDPDGALSYNTIPVISPSHGSIVIQPDGSYVYTPVPGFIGTETIVVEVCDNGTPAFCTNKTLSIKVDASKDTIAPLASADAATASVGNEVLVNVANNDTDATGNLDPSRVDLDPLTEGIQQSLVLPGKGTVTVDAKGNVIFLAEPGFVGNLSVAYTIADDAGNVSNTALINITVESNLPPGVIVPNAFSPNNDGQNDLFIIEGAEQYDVTLYVYNRWGNIVYASKHYKNDWSGVAINVQDPGNATRISGTSDTSKLPEGTYFYVVEFAGDHSKHYSSFVELRR
ncbi:tandem-95 repeat protein, partial [Chryseosolibacter indicus]